MRLTRIGYYVDFWLYPLLILALAVAAFTTSGLRPALYWSSAFLIGLASWTLLEYALHRLVLHHAPYFAAMHERHHDDPSGMIGTPTWLSVGLGVVSVLLPVWALLDFAFASGLTAGMMLGYLWYISVHHASHHWLPKRGSYLCEARLRHLRHHYSREAGNFGVTTPLWDWVFGTALDERRRSDPRREIDPSSGPGDMSFS
jgi:sterol desaturase/sphingolipid hydroxylase (fatty acid hydroxylase superfamily)